MLWEQAFINSYDHKRHLIFDQHSTVISWWDSFLVLGVIYSTAYTPLAVVFHEARWPQHEVVDVTLDVLFFIDLLVRFRISFRDHGYDVTHPPTVRD